MFEFERATKIDSLHQAWNKVSAKNGAAGTDNITLDFYRQNLSENLEKLHYYLETFQYIPYPEKEYDVKKRSVYISCLDDKIVQTAAANVIYENINDLFSKSAHGYIKMRSVDTAHKSLNSAIQSKTVEFYKADIKKFYESIDKNILMDKVRNIAGDKKFVELIDLLLVQHKSGISTGSCLSPVLSNLYLLDFDSRIENRSIFYSRYVDDIIVAPEPADTMESIICDIDKTLADLRLRINGEKSEIVNANSGFKYLGFDIKGNIVDKLISEKNYALAEKLLNEKTPEMSMETHDYGNYIKLFVRDTDKFYVSDSPQERYIEYSGNLDNEKINQLINSKKEFAVPALNNDGLCSFAVFDVDINKEVILRYGDDGDMFKTLLAKTKETASNIQSRIKELEVQSYIEFSGYKGYHVWVFWEQRISLDSQKKFFANVLLDMEAPLGIHVEKFPVTSDAKQAIKLPLSFHSVRNNQATFLSGNLPQLEFIGKIKPSKYPDIGDIPAETKTNDKNNQIPAIPAHITAIYNKCGVVKSIVDKAKNEKYINYHERMTILHVFHCLGDEGAKYIHDIMSGCINYDYAITQKFIDGCNGNYPIGCKKIMERFEGVYDNSKCHCSFHNENMYPSPVIHAKRVAPNCFKATTMDEKIGHPKQVPTRENATDFIAKLLDLNKKEYEIHSQQKICTGQIESLFKKNEVKEMQTPQGMLIKTEDGLFLKIGG